LKTNKKSQNETNTKTIETSTQAMPKVPPKNSNVTKGDKKSENKK